MKEKTKKQLLKKLKALQVKMAKPEKFAVERRQVQEALKASEEKYRTLIENVNIGVYRTTGRGRGRFLHANPAIAKMFGYRSVKEFIKIPVCNLYQNSQERKVFLEQVLELLRFSWPFLHLLSCLLLHLF